MYKRSNYYQVVMYSMRTKLIYIVGLTVSIWGMLLSNSVAKPITFEFSGNIIFVSPELSAQFNTSQDFSLTYTFESTTPYGFNDYFFDPVTAMTYTIGSYVGGLGEPGGGGEAQSFIRLNSSVSPPMRYDFGARASGPTFPPSPPASGPIFPHDVGFYIQNFDSPLFSSTLTLPETLNFSPDVVAVFFVNFAETPGGAGGGTVFGLLHPLQTVPEPSTVVLLGAGMAALVTLRGLRRLHAQDR
jgi:hypothetical protein